MKKWITLSLCLLMSAFAFGQSENNEEQPFKGYEISGYITGKYIPCKGRRDARTADKG